MDDADTWAHIALRFWLQRWFRALAARREREAEEFRRWAR